MAKSPRVNVKLKNGIGPLRRMTKRTLKNAAQSEPAPTDEQILDAAARGILGPDVEEEMKNAVEADARSLLEEARRLDDASKVLSGEVQLPVRGVGTGERVYRPAYATHARMMCKLGATDVDLSEWFSLLAGTPISVGILQYWRARHPDFNDALKVGKGEFDDRVERTLAMRAVGYSYEAEKIFCSDGKVTRVPYREHVPPDTTAMIFWLKNRRPDDWRDVNHHNHHGPLSITITEEEAMM